MSFPIQSMRLFFSTSKVVSFYERNKKNRKFVCLYLTFHTLPLLPKTKGADYLFVTSALDLSFTPAYAAFALATMALKASG